MEESRTKTKRVRLFHVRNPSLSKLMVQEH